jgi:hypothetical protein
MNLPDFCNDWAYHLLETEEFLLKSLLSCLNYVAFNVINVYGPT